MKSLQFGFCVAAFAVVLNAAAVKCSDIPLSFTISPGYTDPTSGTAYTGGIRPDSGGTYVNGQNGVIAVIHACNGSNGASLNPGTQRSLTYDFRTAVYTDGATPSWTATVQTLNTSSLNFSNLLYNYAPNATYSFTTYLKYVSLGNSYYFGMENPAANAPLNSPEAINSPCTTSLVNVKHIPATTNPTTPETWIVWADDTSESCMAGSVQQVGTLYQYGKSGNISVNAGQFRVPFYMTLQRLP